MAFRIRQTSYRAWPVTVLLQECDAQGVVAETRQTFVGHFKAFAEAQHQAMIEALDARYPLPAEQDRLDLPTVLRRNADYFGQLLTGWGPEVTDDGGTPLPFTAEALTAMITGPDGLAISAALSRAVSEIRFGVAPAKNSLTSPAPGESPAGPGEVQTNQPPT